MADTNGTIPRPLNHQDQLDGDRPSVSEPARDDAPDKVEPTLRDRADVIREQSKYRSRLTRTLLNKLAPLLVQQTPHDLGPGVEMDRGFAHLLLQRSVMDDVLLPCHWRDLIHYEDGGRTARVWVVVGNRLGRVKLNPTTGALKPGPDAEIIKAWDGWGGLDSANSKGDLLKSTQTSALRRLLAQIGPGRDAFTAPAGTLEQTAQYVPDLTAIAGAGEPKADELDVKLLLKVIRDRGLAPRQVANLIRAAAGAAPVNHATESAAREFVDERLNDQRIVLARDVAPRLKGCSRRRRRSRRARPRASTLPARAVSTSPGRSRSSPPPRGRPESGPATAGRQCPRDRSPEPARGSAALALDNDMKE